MSSLWLKRLLTFAPVIVALVLVLGSSTPAHADFTCFQDLRDCYGRAATRQSFWDIWLSGLDCELTFADCSRRAIIGR